jgi:hypothetical protein
LPTIDFDMDRLDRGQLVEAGCVAPGEEVLTGALVRGASVVVGDRAEEIGEAFGRARADVGDQRWHDDRPAERVSRIDDRRHRAAVVGCDGGDFDLRDRDQSIIHVRVPS